MSQPESKLSREIIGMIRARGGYAIKIVGGPMMQAGTPDIAGCYRARPIYFETKMPEGKQPTPIQQHRASEIRAAGGYILSPCRSVAEARRMLDAIEAEDAQ